MRRAAISIAGVVVVLAVAVAIAANSVKVKSRIVGAMTPTYKPSGDPSNLTASFYGGDEKLPRIDVSLEKVADGFAQITDVQFVPGADEVAIVLQKEGEAKWSSFRDRKSGTFFTEKVLTASEEGLLGLAFHPKFAGNGRFFVDAVVAKDGDEVSQITEWAIPAGADVRTAKPVKKRVLLEQKQPYPNHNAGQLAFGPDGFLYVGFGDGGFKDDPHGNGQKTNVWLGKMLRIDVDHADQGKAYAVPKDNPFVGKAEFLPEIWALGLRNPWRYSFDPRGRLIVADVGQDTWEEVDVVARGDNLGWNVREARHCFSPKKDCRTDGLVDPIYEYSHQEGQSITGGFVYTGERIPALKGKYVFGDFVAGKLWAIDLPESVTPGAPLAKASALGKWPLLPSTFGRDAHGEIYLGDFGTGAVFRIAPPVTAAAATDAGR